MVYGIQKCGIWYREEGLIQHMVICYRGIERVGLIDSFNIEKVGLLPALLMMMQI
jgi:hypothetical protein